MICHNENSMENVWIKTDMHTKQSDNLLEIFH